MTSQSNHIKRPLPLWAHILRTLLIGLLLCGVVAGTLYLHVNTLPDLAADLTDTEQHPAFPPSAEGIVNWITDELGLLLPFLAVLILCFVIYRPFDRHDGKAQREMVYEILLVAIFTFVVLLPYVARISEAEVQAALAAGEEFPVRENGVKDTLLLNLTEWFLRTGIGLGILGLYHSMRAQREAKEYREALHESPVTTEETGTDATEETGTTA